MRKLPEDSPASIPAGPNFFHREVLLAREWVSLLFRDFHKYAAITAGLYFADGTGRTNGIRPAYFFCRHVDDIADGDREVPGNEDFSQLIERLLQQLECGIPGDSTGAKLLDHAIQAAHQQTRAEVSSCFRQFLQTALFDYERRTQSILLSSDELDAHYRSSFEPVHDLACIAGRLTIRSADLAPLQLLQGKVYALRDLNHELPRGEVNVPREVIAKTGLPLVQIQKYSNPSSLPAISEWMKHERQSAESLLQEVESGENGVSKPILSALLPSIRRYLKR